jgi:outer membrane receptor protein involved in Fe transport
VDAAYGFSTEGGKTNVMITGHYSDAKPLLNRDRVDALTRGINIALQRIGLSYFYGPTYQAPIFPIGTTPTISSVNGKQSLVFKNGATLNSPITFIPAGTSSSTSVNTLVAGLLANAGQTNLNLADNVGQYGLKQQLGSVPVVKSFSATIRRQMKPWLEAFSEFTYGDDDSSGVYNPLGSSRNSVRSTSPANPFNQTVRISIPTSYSLPARSRTISESIAAGFIGKLPFDWTVELDYTWSCSKSNYQNALIDSGAISGDLNSGVLNPFVDTLAYPLDVSKYVLPLTYHGYTANNDFALRASGPLQYSALMAPANLTCGMEHIRAGYPATVNYRKYPITPFEQTDYILGQTSTANSLYAEGNIPLIKPEWARPGLKALDLQIAQRIETTLSSVGTTEYIHQVFNGTITDTYIPTPPGGSGGPAFRTLTSYQTTNSTAGIRYKPVDDVIIRASYAQAFIPPQYSQLLPNPIPDPFTTTIFDPKTNSSYDVTTLSGGNPNLRPEHSKSWDVGLIYEPTTGPLKGLRLDVEYFKITQFDHIEGLSTDTIVATASLSSRVTRDPATGLITSVDTTLVNVDRYETEGWDFSFDYRKPTGLGTFDASLAASMMAHQMRRTTAIDPLFDYVGFPSQGGAAKLKLNGTLGWEHKAWNVAWTTTWYGSYSQFGAPGTPTVGYQPTFQPIILQGGNTIPSQKYHQLVVGYKFGREEQRKTSGATVSRRLLSDLSVQVGIKNLFNTAPPYDASYGPFYYSPYGDIRGRSYWVRVKKQF